MRIQYTGNLPQRMSEGAAGSDLVSDKEYVIKPNEQAMVDTGTAVAIPYSSFGMLLPRSSLCNKKGLMMANSMGVIDSDYRGTMKCCYRNIGDEEVVIKKGERICQLIIMDHRLVKYIETDELSDTVRGTGGFGSTGEK